MVNLVVGLVGGGKTYYCLSLIVNHISRGGVVVSNIQLNLNPFYDDSELYAKSNPKEFKINGISYNAKGLKRTLKDSYSWNYQEGQYIYLSDDDISGDVLSRVPSGTENMHVMLIIDESAEFFDSRDWKNADDYFLSFLRHVRKEYIDVFFIVQVYKDINVRIRRSCHYVYHCIDISKVKILGFGTFFKNIPYYGSCIRLLTFPPADYLKANKKPVEKSWIKKNIDIFSCYNTTAIHNNKYHLLKTKTNFSKDGKVDNSGFYNSLLFACLRSFIYAITLYLILDRFSK